jgi:MFS family permease
VIGGIGLGIGYISPVSTISKWFPDRPGLATGMAIMGFGGVAGPHPGRRLLRGPGERHPHADVLAALDGPALQRPPASASSSKRRR